MNKYLQVIKLLYLACFSLYSVEIAFSISWKFPWYIRLWFLPYEDVSFISLWKADTLRLVSCFHSYFWVCFFRFYQYLVHKLPLAVRKAAAPSCVILHLTQWGWGDDKEIGLLFLCHGTLGCLCLCTGCSMCVATSGLQRDWEDASLCLQIFPRISADFFTLVPAVWLWFFRIFSLGLGFFFPTPASSASLSVLVWHAAYVQEHDTDKKHGFKIILLYVNSGNHLCKCAKRYFFWFHFFCWTTCSDLLLKN